MFSDVISFIVSFAINLLLIGLMVAGGTATAFRFIHDSSPRLRYVIALIAFVFATFVPLAVTSRGLFEPQSSLITITAEHRKLPADLSPLNQTRLSERDLLADVAGYVSTSWLGWLFSVLWISAAACLLLRELAGHWQLKSERKKWDVADAEQRKKFFCPEHVTLYFADYGSFTTGFFSPAIVLPRQFPDNLFRNSIQGIVLHEMDHARWRDPFVNSLLRIFRALFWVSPALWFLEHIIRSEREAAADRTALVSLSNSHEADETSADYATAIISMAKLHAVGSSQQQRCLVATYFGGASNLENRIRRIFNYRSQPAGFRILLGVAVFLTSVLTLTIIPVASIPTREVQAEFSPGGLNDNAESKAEDFFSQASGPILREDRNNDLSKRNNAQRSSKPASRKTKDEPKADQRSEIPSVRSVEEPKDNNAAEQKIQINHSTNTVLNQQLNFDYRGVSAKPVIRIVVQPVLRIVF